MRYLDKTICIFILILTSCDIEEEPPFLTNENVYSTASNVLSALNGIYAGVGGYKYMGYSYVELTNLNSGFGVTNRGGNNNRNINNISLCSLKPLSASEQVENSWEAIYEVIGRTNDAIKSAEITEIPVTSDEKIINDFIGQAYFIRAFSYFNLVRLWGEVPLRTEPSTKETVYMAKSPIPDIYAQIVSDVKNAQQWMNGSIGNGTAKPEAADMLLAKVYMTLATAPVAYGQSGLDYWQMAYDEAIKVYGAYSLLDDYSSLFNPATGDNTSESVFEIQYSETASSGFTRAFTPNWYINAKTFGRLKVNVEVYNRHVATYPDDPRLATTYISKWTRSDNGKLAKNYPIVKSRSNFGNSFPFLFKLGSKDSNSESRVSNENFIIYRYADLLLMLSEISNELQNGEEMKYVEEVLERVGLTPQQGYFGGQDSFRNAIMQEYQFELLFETHDWFNNRRRGYNYFLNNVIIPHNTAPTFDPRVDVTLETDEATVMHLPIPASEINSNEDISE